MCFKRAICLTSFKDLLTLKKLKIKKGVATKRPISPGIGHYLLEITVKQPEMAVFSVKTTYFSLKTCLFALKTLNFHDFKTFSQNFRDFKGLIPNFRDFKELCFSVKAAISRRNVIIVRPLQPAAAICTNSTNSTVTTCTTNPARRTACIGPFY